MHKLRILLIFIVSIFPSLGSSHPTGFGQKVIIIGTGITDFPLAYEACFSTDNFFWNSTCPNGSTEQIGVGAGAPYDLTIEGLHDTRVAAIVNEIAPDAELIAFQIYSRHKSNGLIIPFHSDTIRALDHALELALQGEPIAAIVLAQGGSTIYTDNAICAQNAPGIEDLGHALAAEGVALVVSGGNTISETGLVLPAICEGNIAVSALVDGEPYGSHGPQSQLFASGQILYGGQAFEGSSYASPRVAATIALQKENSPSRTVAENLSAMLAHGVPVGNKPKLDDGGDADFDGIPALFDNCLDVYNPDQVDPDDDGYGVRCDPDVNNDGGVNVTDAGFCRQFFHDPNLTEFTMYDPYGNPLWTVQRVDCDLNQDGVIDNGDLAVMVPYFYGPSGPSGLIQ